MRNKFNIVSGYKINGRFCEMELINSKEALLHTL